MNEDHEILLRHLFDETYTHLCQKCRKSLYLKTDIDDEIKEELLKLRHKVITAIYGHQKFVQMKPENIKEEMKIDAEMFPKKKI